MFRFTIRDVLWLMALVWLAVCFWIDHRSLTKLSSESKLDKQRLQRQRDTIDSLAIENSQLAERLRKRQLLQEAEPGVFFLGPGKQLPFPR